MSITRSLTNFVRDAIAALPALADVPVWSIDETDCQACIAKSPQQFSGLFVSVEIPGGDVGQKERRGPHFPDLPIYVDVHTLPIMAHHKTISEPLREAGRDPMLIVEAIMEGIHLLASEVHSVTTPVATHDRFFIKRWGIAPPRDERDPFTIYRIEIVKDLNLGGLLT